MLIYIISHNIVISPWDIHGSIEERYWIYKDVIDFIMKKGYSEILWYSTKNKQLLRMSSAQRRSIMINGFQYLALLVKDAIRVREPMIIIIAYPYVLEGLNKLLLLLVLTTLKTISLFKKNIVIIIDDIDPPVETAISDSTKPLSMLKYFMLRAYDLLLLKRSTLIVVLTESYRNYISHMYKIPIEKFIIIPPPALCKLIPYSPPKNEGPLTILYSGVVKKERNIEPLIQAINELRNEGYKINFIITSPLIQMSLPSNIDCRNYPWPKYVREALSKADVAIIPYRHDKIHYSYTLVAKLFDYLTAGKPVITTPLYETLKILRKCKCGFVFIDKENLKNVFKFIYANRMVLTAMSKRGRQIMEKEFCDSVLALKLFHGIIRMLSDKYHRRV